MLDLLNQPRYVDLAPAQVWARELDEGRWWCSPSTMYRILRAAGQNGERRRQATHPAHVKPELVADASNRVWSWDITKLRGPAPGVWYHLYTVIDIFSRYVVGYLVAAREDGQLAEALIADAATRERVDRDQLTIHADRGGAMTCKTVTQLLSDLRITRSHSRPKTSNDCDDFLRHLGPGLTPRNDRPCAFGLICRLVLGVASGPPARRAVT